jgi:hypothetical protein
MISSLHRKNSTKAESIKENCNKKFGKPESKWNL